MKYLSFAFALALTVLMGVALSLVISSCNKDEKITTNTPAQASDRDTDADLFKKHVAMVDARARSISQDYFVKEIVFISFSPTYALSNEMIYEGATFLDDGTYNDATAGDGVYTSPATFSHNTNVPFTNSFDSRSVLEEIVIDPAFEHVTELETMDYQKPFTSGSVEDRGPVATIECDVEFGTCGCRADNWGWCDCCCVTFSNCRVKVGWE